MKNFFGQTKTIFDIWHLRPIIELLMRKRKGEQRYEGYNTPLWGY